MRRKRSFVACVPMVYSDEAIMRWAIERGCWRCSCDVKAVGARKVVCVVCGCGMEWSLPSVDGS